MACAELDTRDTVASEPADSAFQAIVEAGPVNSEELQRIVTTYAANGRLDAATAAFKDFLLETSNDESMRCSYCVSLLSAVDTAFEDELVVLLFDAMDQVLEESYLEGSGEALVDLALMVASAKNRSNWDRAFYYMANAVQFGISDESKLPIVQFLSEVGHLADARELSVTIFEDESSVHYQSDVARQWITWLGSEIERQETLGSMLVAAATD